MCTGGWCTRFWRETVGPARPAKRKWNSIGLVRPNWKLNLFWRAIPFRPLPPRGAGEEDFRLDSLERAQTGPLPPCVAGVRDSRTLEKQAAASYSYDSKENESHSPAGQAGRGLGRVLRASSWKSGSPA